MLRRTHGLGISPSLLTAVALCVSAANGNPGQPTMRSARCAVATAYIEALLAKPSKLPHVFSTQREQVPDLPEPSNWIDARSHKHGASPSQPLLRQLLSDAGQNSVTSCTSVRAALDKHHIKYGAKAVDAVAQSSNGSSYKADISSVSLPLVSWDGKEAVLISSGASGPLAAGGFLEYLRKLPSGEWVVVSVAGLWVS